MLRGSFAMLGRGEVWAGCKGINYLRKTAGKGAGAVLHGIQHQFVNLQLALTCVMFVWIFYASTTMLIFMLWRSAPLPTGPPTARRA